ncbi:hypothetical protein VNO80_30214 [Phaseolus coccineus]|uniref:Uncharacterized protein n=1 Tax=Phaseolus coccineus TaxID=3886 RepID=A0AAN9QFW1_PHACN
MEVTNFFSFIVNNPEAPIPYPWERVFDIQRRVVYYKQNENGEIVFDCRSPINVGGGVFMENSPLSSYMNQQSRLVVHQLIREYQLSYECPRVFLFSISRNDERPFYHIVQEPVIQCPSCNITIRGLP